MGGCLFNVVYEHVGLGLCLAALGGRWLLGGRGGGSRKEHIDMPGDGECKHFISCVNILCICLQSVHVKITVANQILVRGQIFLLLIRWYTFLRAAVALFADDCWRIFCGQRGDNGGNFFIIIFIVIVSERRQLAHNGTESGENPRLPLLRFSGTFVIRLQFPY